MRTAIGMGGPGAPQGTLNDGSLAGIVGNEPINPSVFDVSWAGAGTTNAPATADYWEGAVGINNDGATGANVYHIVEISGTLTWVDTGATVANLYGV